MSTPISQMQPAMQGQDQQKVSLDKRLGALFWALLFIMAGTLWLFPAEKVPKGAWLAGIGLILLLLNVVRVLNGVPARVAQTVVGALALAAGLAMYAGVELPLIPLTFIAIGASIIFELLPARKT